MIRFWGWRAVALVRLWRIRAMMEAGFLWLFWRLPLRRFGWWLARAPVRRVDRSLPPP